MDMILGVVHGVHATINLIGMAVHDNLSVLYLGCELLGKGEKRIRELTALCVFVCIFNVNIYKMYYEIFWLSIIIVNICSWQQCCTDNI